MKAKEIDGLDCEAGAGAGIELVVRTRLEEMCAFRTAALDWSDPAGIHDMRVASRRLRSVVRDFSPYFRSRKLRHARANLKVIADALGAVRDEDVEIMALEKLTGEAPPELAAGIEQFAEERRLRRNRARTELEEVLTDNALSELLEEFDAALAKGFKVVRHRKGRRDEQKSVEEVTFRQLGSELLRARLQELQNLSESLSRPLKTKPLHKMRLAAKYLRYALELFAPCWPDEPLRAFAKEIARLQTSLGELHDCDLWIADLGAALRSSNGAVASEAAQRQERSAAVWLLDYFVKERADHFRAALARWHEWETTGFQSRLVNSL